MAGLGVGLASTGAVSGRSAAVATPTVLTRNVYLGLDLTRLFRAESLGDVKRIAGQFLDEIDPSVYEARAEAIAGEIAATDADVVALQEAATFRSQRPSDYGSESEASATAVLVDMLAEITSALAARGLDYTVAAETVTTDLELPAATDDGTVDVRITDRDVLLVRSDVDVGSVVTDTFDAALELQIPDSSKTAVLQRGFCSATVQMGEGTFTAVSTHLESVTELFRLSQAKELLDRVPTAQPVVLCGDFNSGPGGQTYDRLTASFDDAYAVRRPDSEGYTCCQASDVRNDESQLTRRIDAVLYRGGLRPTTVRRVGHEPSSRVEARAHGETITVWPSDHAGVAATFELPTTTPTATPEPTADPPASPTESDPTATETPSPTATTSPTATVGGSGPGMGLTAAVAGMVLGVLARAFRD
ncbi:endonuclease/exonuclease/phosphatase family protein [Halomicroarcula sp. S1AR25-4]|uniref:endonuclease/exonuclease/phosphatase family protein n=1 Tax=Haloarcula sp. S1AR25-4 TaxID=2950538 RepID=UPI002874CBB5|nr:endonuclease/exonuclease/phosphatase family protein [Halomicroarcula sp. S1AR25-4]MDS0279712.1 endonuclease/exonuclease/phosphatase family protein [Halomicroarcula sp. S1AR25-4]